MNGEKAHCNGCGFEGEADTFNPCPTAWHDLRCPSCGTTDINTSAINASWKEEGKIYGYGDDNCLIVGGPR
jgi:predicted RNA-binding Zn-ribbon protein involved in translation (DUF1610 family)